MEHLENVNLIKDYQHGFRSGRTCATNILTFLEDSTRKLCCNLIRFFQSFRQSAPVKTSSKYKNSRYR